jgi:hypothetical protein
VRRRWLPLLTVLDAASNDFGVFSTLALLVAIPMLLVWPFWLLAKLCGVKWKVVTERDGTEVAVEKVKGYRASRRRIDEIVADVRAKGRAETGEPQSGAIELT